MQSRDSGNGNDVEIFDASDRLGTYIQNIDSSNGFGTDVELLDSSDGFRSYVELFGTSLNGFDIIMMFIKTTHQNNSNKTTVVPGSKQFQFP